MDKHEILLKAINELTNELKSNKTITISVSEYESLKEGQEVSERIKTQHEEMAAYIFSILWKDKERFLGNVVDRAELAVGYRYVLDGYDDARGICSNGFKKVEL